MAAARRHKGGREGGREGGERTKRHRKTKDCDK